MSKTRAGGTPAPGSADRQEKAPSRAQRKLQQRREKAEAASVPQELGLTSGLGRGSGPRDPVFARLRVCVFVWGACGFSTSRFVGNSSWRAGFVRFRIWPSARCSKHGFESW